MFDPYHKWLGIPVDQRPPTHYQLLGVAPDEADREVIESAAIRQMAYVRNFQSGQHAKDCARVLGELAQARLILADPAKRAAYDAGLAKAEPAHPLVVAGPAVALDRIGLDTGERATLKEALRRNPRGRFSFVAKHLMVTGLAVAVGFFALGKLLNRMPAAEKTTQSAPPVLAKNSGEVSSKKGEDQGRTASAEAPRKAGAALIAQTDRDAALRDKLPPPKFSGNAWRIEGDELVQESLDEWLGVEFGDPSWSAYDMSFEAMVVKGTQGIFAKFHIDNDNYCSFEMGAHDNTQNQCLVWSSGAWWYAERHPGNIVHGEWHSVKMEIRGTRYGLFMDGQKLFDVPNGGLRSGRVGITTMGIVSRFRNILVTSPEGKPLWRGLPTPPLAEKVKVADEVGNRPAGPQELPDRKGPAAIPDLKPTPVVGSWHHTTDDGFDDIVEFKEDGRLFFRNQHQGNWTQVAKKLTLKWNFNVVDEVELGITGTSYEGKNRKGVGIHGKKLAVPSSEPVAKPIAAPVAKPVAAAPAPEPVGELRRFVGRGNTDVQGVAYSPDGHRALTSGGWRNHTVRLWDVETGRELRVMPGHTSNALRVAFLPDGRRAISSSVDRTLRLWDLETGNSLGRFEGHEGPVIGVAVTPDGRYALSGSDDKTLRLWDIATATEVRKFVGHAEGVVGVAISPDGRRGASAGRDKAIGIWDLATGKLIRSLAGHTATVESVAFSPDGRSLLSGSQDHTVVLWNLKTGSPTRQMVGHTDKVYGIAFLPDGSRAVSCGEDRTIRLWDLKTARQVQSFDIRTGTVFTVAVSPDGRRVLGSCTDGTAWLGALPDASASPPPRAKR